MVPRPHHQQSPPDRCYVIPSRTTRLCPKSPDYKFIKLSISVVVFRFKMNHLFHTRRLFITYRLSFNKLLSYKPTRCPSVHHREVQIIQFHRNVLIMKQTECCITIKVLFHVNNQRYNNAREGGGSLDNSESKIQRISIHLDGRRLDNLLHLPGVGDSHVGELEGGYGAFLFSILLLPDQSSAGYAPASGRAVLFQLACDITYDMARFSISKFSIYITYIKVEEVVTI